MIQYTGCCFRTYILIINLYVDGRIMFNYGDCISFHSNPFSLVKKTHFQCSLGPFYYKERNNKKKDVLVSKDTISFIIITLLNIFILHTSDYEITSCNTVLILGIPSGKEETLPFKKYQKKWVPREIYCIWNSKLLGLFSWKICFVERKIESKMNWVW